MSAVKCNSDETYKNVPFEEALELTGFGRYNLVMSILTGCIIMSVAFETMSVAYLVPASACELETSSANQGIMAGMPLMGILAASNVWGYLADTRGRRKILIISLTLGFLAGAVATLSPNWIVFCFLKFMSSSSMAGSYGLGLTYLSECSPERKRFKLLLWMTSVFLFCSGSMAALTIPILPLKFSYHIPVLNIYFNSWRLLNIVFSIPCGIGAIGLFFALESPKYLLSVGQDEEALKVLRNIYLLNTGTDSYKVQQVVLDEDSISPVKGVWASIVAQTTPLLKPPLMQKTLLLSAIFITVYFCINPFTVWLPYMADGFMKSLEKGDVGLTFCQMLRSSRNVTSYDQPDDCTLNSSAMTMVFSLNVLLAMANVILASLLPLLGRKTILIGIKMVSGTACIMMNFSTNWVLTAILAVVFIGGVLNFGYLSIFSVDIFPTYVKAMGVCLTLMVGRGSAVLGINVLKTLLDTNCESAFYIFGSITLVGGCIAFLLPREKEKKITRKCPES